MYKDYFDAAKFETVEHPSESKDVIRLDVTDIRKDIRCPKCGKQMVSRGKRDSVFFDVDDRSKNQLKILYIVYHHIRGYRCKQCSVDTNEPRVITSDSQMSRALKIRIAQLLWSSSSRNNIKLNDLIKKFQVPSGTQENKTISLITKYKIFSILHEYETEIKKLVESYEMCNELLYYPFSFRASKTGTSKTGTSKTGTNKTGTNKTGTNKTGTNKTGTNKYGALFGIDIQDETCENNGNRKKPEVKLYIYKFDKEYSDLSLKGFLQSKADKNIGEITRIYLSPIYSPYDETYKFAHNAFHSYFAEAILYEFKRAYNKTEVDTANLGLSATLSANAYRCKREVEKRIENPKFSGDKSRKFFEEIFAFLKSDDKLFEYYKDVYASFKNNFSSWSKSERIPDRETKQSLEDFDNIVEKYFEQNGDFKYLLTRIMLDIPSQTSVICRYDWRMGSITKPNKFDMTFTYCSAAAVMLRPTCNEYFIFRVESLDKNLYYLIVGYDDKKYCRYDIVDGQNLKHLLNYFDQLTIWEVEQVGRVYCSFDKPLFEMVSTIFFNAEIRVDLSELIFKYCDCCSDSQVDFFEESILSSLSNLQTDSEIVFLKNWYNALSDIDRDSFSAVYKQMAAAPELLRYQCSFLELGTYQDYRLIYDLAFKISDIASKEDLQLMLRDWQVRPCISTQKELVGHHVLMGYEDLKISLSDWIKCMNDEMLLSEGDFLDSEG